MFPEEERNLPGVGLDASQSWIHSPPSAKHQKAMQKEPDLPEVQLRVWLYVARYLSLEEAVALRCDI